MIIEAEYGADEYISVKDGGEPIIHDCPECSVAAYVSDGETDVCYFCDETVTGECAMCGDRLTVGKQSVNSSPLCDYCDYRMDKIMRE